MGEEYGISGNRECSTETGIPELGGRTCGEKTLRVVTEVLEPSSSCSLLVLSDFPSLSHPQQALRRSQAWQRWRFTSKSQCRCFMGEKGAGGRFHGSPARVADPRVSAPRRETPSGPQLCPRLSVNVQWESMEKRLRAGINFSASLSAMLANSQAGFFSPMHGSHSFLLCLGSGFQSIHPTPPCGDTSFTRSQARQFFCNLSSQIISEYAIISYVT